MPELVMTSGSLSGDLEGRLRLYDNPYLLW
jgi:hypothetical protein